MGPPLRYASGEDLHIGDRIETGGMVGTVACVISSGEFSEEFPEEHWAYLARGFLFRSEDGVLIHFVEPEEGACLISRRGPGNGSSREIRDE